MNNFNFASAPNENDTPTTYLKGCLESLQRQAHKSQQGLANAIVAMGPADAMVRLANEAMVLQYGANLATYGLLAIEKEPMFEDQVKAIRDACKRTLLDERPWNNTSTNPHRNLAEVARSEAAGQMLQYMGLIVSFAETIR